MERIISNSYDEVPYKSFPYRQSHPDRLATVAALFGLKPTDVRNCRVLELGCASGGNLIPMAAQLPESSFVGIDASPVQVGQGRATIEATKLKNVELRQQNILDIGPSDGKFDYIIAHGIYSWVPDQVQDKIIEICSENLAPDGVAYVSYNTYPGWRMRGMIRDMMSYRARSFTKPAERMRQARALLDFLSQSVPTENNAYGILLKNELTQMRDKDDSYLLHDYLEEVNEPIYFYQFVEHAQKHRLQYLAEADYRVMATSNFPRRIEAVLQTIAADLIETEQYMDFLRNRMFRQTLLCHQELKIDRESTPNSILQMHIGGNIQAKSANFDVRSNERIEFRSPVSTMTTSEPIVKAAMRHLGQIWPKSTSFASLYAAARAALGWDATVVDTTHVTADTRRLAESMVRCYAISMIELSLLPASFCLEVSEKPLATPLARYQAGEATVVTNQKHEAVHLNDLQRQILRHLDGQHDVSAIIQSILELTRKGEVVIHLKQEPLTDESQLREFLGQVVPDSLAKLARAGVLVN